MQKEVEVLLDVYDGWDFLTAGHGVCRGPGPNIKQHAHCLPAQVLLKSKTDRCSSKRLRCKVRTTSRSMGTQHCRGSKSWPRESGETLLFDHHSKTRHALVRKIRGVLSHGRASWWGCPRRKSRYLGHWRYGGLSKKLTRIVTSASWMTTGNLERAQVASLKLQVLVGKMRDVVLEEWAWKTQKAAGYPPGLCLAWAKASRPFLQCIEVGRKSSFAVDWCQAKDNCLFKLSWLIWSWLTSRMIRVNHLFKKYILVVDTRQAFAGTGTFNAQVCQGGCIKMT